jgi:hypothetical protein
MLLRYSELPSKEKQVICSKAIPEKVIACIQLDSLIIHGFRYQTKTLSETNVCGSMLTWSGESTVQQMSNRLSDIRVSAGIKPNTYTNQTLFALLRSK